MTEPMNNPGYFDQSYLTKLAQILKEIKNRSYEVMHVTPGQHIIDIGCGPATDTLPLSRLVGPTGQVIGIDYDEAMVQEANQQAHQAGVDGYVMHICAAVPPIPYPNGTFDLSHSERLLQHLDDPQSVLAEMVRVTRPGGLVVVVDTDHSSASFDYQDGSLADTEWAVRRARVEMLKNGFSGRMLYRLFTQAGLHDIHFEFFPVPFTNFIEARYILFLDKAEQYALAKGTVDQTELNRFNAALEKADQEGSFFAYGMVLLVAGRVG